MNHNESHDRYGQRQPAEPWYKTPKGLLILVCLGAVGYWLYTYHLDHALGFLPYAIILLCPLMHLFMHGGHGNHGHKDATQENDNSKETH